MTTLSRLWSDFTLMWSLPEFIGAFIEDLPTCPECVFIALCIGVLAFGSFFF